MNNNHNAHHLAGLPEWADQEAADAAVAALGLSSVAPEQKVAVDVREEWAVAANFFWATAYQALVERDFKLMRAAATQGKEADEVASPQGALLAAVFGVCQKRPPEKVVQVGRTLPVDQCRDARKAVQAEMNRFADARKAQQPKRAVKPAPTAQDWLDQGGKVYEGVVSNFTGLDVRRDGGFCSYSLPRDARDLVGKRVRFVVKGLNALVLEVL